VNLTELTQDSLVWRAFVNTVTELRAPEREPSWCARKTKKHLAP